MVKHYRVCGSMKNPVTELDYSLVCLNTGVSVNNTRAKLTTTILARQSPEHLFYRTLSFDEFNNDVVCFVKIFRTKCYSTCSVMLPLVVSYLLPVLLQSWFCKSHLNILFLTSEVCIFYWRNWISVLFFYVSVSNWKALASITISVISRFFPVL